MTAPKTQIKKILDRLPEDSSYDEILKELAFFKIVERGLKDSKNGKIITNEDMKKRIKSW